MLVSHMSLQMRTNLKRLPFKMGACTSHAEPVWIDEQSGFGTSRHEITKSK